MNPFLFIIIFAILADFGLGSLSKWLTLRSLSSNLPDEFVGYYDEVEYARSQEYTQAKIRFGIIVTTVDILIVLPFILLGGFNFIDQYIRSLEWSSIPTGLLFFGILLLAKDLISLPFSVYSQFILEEKFGFNHSTWKTFILDRLKGYMLLAVLGGLVVGCILYFFQSAGTFAWLYAWLITTAFTLIMQPLYIHFIAPLFNTFTPLEPGELKDAIQAFMRQVDFPFTGLYVMDGSRRTAHSNAYFTGFGRQKRIVLFDTLLTSHSNDEIIAILAHEVGHYKKKHVIKGLITSIIHSGILFFLLSYFISNLQLFQAFRMEDVSVYAGLLFFMMLVRPVQLILSLYFNALSRKHEFEADRFAAEALGRADSMIESLKNLAVKNLQNLTPPRFDVILTFSHPPVLERIISLRNNHAGSS